jgi:hypothetical protein
MPEATVRFWPKLPVHCGAAVRPLSDEDPTLGCYGLPCVTWPDLTAEENVVPPNLAVIYTPHGQDVMWYLPLRS